MSCVPDRPGRYAAIIAMKICAYSREVCRWLEITPVSMQYMSCARASGRKPDTGLGMLTRVMACASRGNMIRSSPSFRYLRIAARTGAVRRANMCMW